METLFAFLIKASTGIILFYVVYWFFLRKETFYEANRWFLVIALFTSLALPLFPVQYSVIFEPENNTNIFKTVTSAFKNAPVLNSDLSEFSIPDSFNWNQAILLVYLTGAVIFLSRLLTQTFILIHQIVKLKPKTIKGFRIVENEKYGLPFSFFNFIFINPKFHTQENLPEILAHENVHIRENHWFDLLFIELLTVIFWFNPFIWFFERSIKQNHEYLADQGVLSQGHSVGRYQALLLNQLMGMQIIGITNNLNFALNTNRLKMMTKKKTSRILGFKFVWALPAIVLLLFAFAEPAYQAKEAETENSISTLQKGEKEFVIHGKVIEEKTGEPLPGASILIKGTPIGTVSDRDGTFTLVDPNPKKGQNQGYYSEVVVSFVGFQTIENTISASGEDVKNISFTFKLKEGVILIDADKYVNQVLPPPPPKVIVEKEEQAPPPPPPPVKGESEKEVFYIVEELPQYPGGLYELGYYVYEMQKKLAKEKNLKGKAKIGFTVNGKGKVVDVKILESDNELAGKGAASIVTGIQDWTPGKQRGKPVSVNYILPVQFK